MVPRAAGARLDPAAAHARHAARMKLPINDRPLLLESGSPSACLGNTSLAFELEMEAALKKAQVDPSAAVSAGRPAPSAALWREVVWHK